MVRAGDEFDATAEIFAMMPDDEPGDRVARLKIRVPRAASEASVTAVQQAKDHIDGLIATGGLSARAVGGS